MCANYIPVTQADRLLSHFGVERGRNEEPVEVWPYGMAPFIRLAEPGAAGRLVAEGGIFGMLRPGQVEIDRGQRTFNARTETVATKVTYREAWARGWRCIVPAEAIYEPYYASKTSKSERWRIELPGGVPMGIAGIYRPWRDPHGNEVFTFSMLTVNADDHPVMSRFHAHGEEKRMVVILKPEDYMAWLTCSVEEAPRFFTQWDGPMDSSAAPRPPRAPRASSGQVVRPPPAPDTGDLFGPGPA